MAACCSLDSDDNKANVNPKKRKLMIESKCDNPSKKKGTIKWREISGDHLNLSYLSDFINSTKSQNIFLKLEKEIQYFTGDLAKVRVYGKWHNLPRQQAAFGDNDIRYTYSGCTVPAMPWTPTLIDIKRDLEDLVPYTYNFCLVNRYRNGLDYMGEHRDDEQELDENTPIASVSFGQHRDFIFRHKDARGKNAHIKIDPVKMVLNNGSLLLMNAPTNSYWYHSLPQRKKLPGIRINLTFRKIVQS